MRNSFDKQLLEAGHDIRTLHLLGRKDVLTTMTYTHMLKKGNRAVRSPVDGSWGGTVPASIDQTQKPATQL